MRKSEWNFEIPTRQSYVAIILIIYKFYKVVIRQAWPFILLFLLRRNSEGVDYWFYILILFGLFSMGFGIWSFFKFYFYIDDDELIIEKGIFKKTKISIPLDRVQTINKEQNLLHRLLSVVKLNIDTAGSVKNEFELDAISEAKADALRDLLLSKKQELVVSNEAEYEDSVDQIVAVEESEPIIQLGFLDLIKVGVTENHFRSAGLIILAMFWIFQNLEQAGIEAEDYEGRVPEVDWSMGFYAILFFVAIFFGIAFMVSLVRTVLSYFDLSFWRQGDGFKVRHGLFNRSEYSALDRKIQIVGWENTLLNKLFSIHKLTMKQAASVAVNAKKSIKVPGVNQAHIDDVCDYYFGQSIHKEETWHQVNIRYMYRSLFYSVLLGLVIIIAGILAKQHLIWIGGALLLAHWVYSSVVGYRKLKYQLTDELLQIRGGRYADKNSIIWTHKVQAVRLIRSPYQLRYGLASLKIYTASGPLTIPFLDLDRAISLKDKLLYLVESSREDWM